MREFTTYPTLCSPGRDFPMKRVLIAVVVLLTLPAAANGQTQLSLQDAIETAQEQSLPSDVAAFAFESAQWSYRATAADFRPQVSLGGRAPGLDRAIDEIQQDDGTLLFVPSSRTNSSMNLRISQAIPLTGGEVFASSALSRIDLFGDNRYNQWQSSPLIVGLRQPLFEFNELKWERRAQPLRLEIAERTYSESMAEIAVDITQAFFEVYIAQMEVDASAFNVAINDTVYSLSRGRYEVGIIAENDLLQSELELINAQTALSNTQLEYERALDDLKLALDIPDATDIEITPPIEILELDIDPQSAVETARRYRSAPIEDDLTVLEAERDLAEARSGSGFGANLTASYGLNQRADVLGDAYASPLNQQRANITFEIPIMRGGAGRARRESAQAALEQTQREVEIEKREFDQQVYYEVVALAQSQRQVEIAARADTIAARRFEVANDRYTIGRIDVTDLFDAQREKDQARRQYIDTLRDYWTSYYRVRQLTLYDFGTGEPLRRVR